METPTKENTLYLPIKQVYFDQIIAGTKKEEYREIKEGITANRYLLKYGNIMIKAGSIILRLFTLLILCSTGDLLSLYR